MSLTGKLEEMNRADIDGNLPRSIHIEVDFIRDILFLAMGNDVNRVISDDRAVYRELLGKAGRLTPDISYKIQLYREPWPLFAFYGVQSDVANLHARKIYLKCGAYIVVDATEAMTVVDVNTGKYTGAADRRETFLRANTEAVVETARQMRLRDVGGIIVVDVLRMSNQADQNAILGALDAELRKDRQKTYVAGFTRLGLLEMTRKKARAKTQPAPDISEI
jgi:ribonuclease G